MESVATGVLESEGGLTRLDFGQKTSCLSFDEQQRSVGESFADLIKRSPRDKVASNAIRHMRV